MSTISHEASAKALIQHIADHLHNLNALLGFSCNITHDPSPIAPSFAYSCSVSDPRPGPRSPVYGWGMTPEAAFQEALRHREMFVVRAEDEAIRQQAMAIRARHEAEAEAEIKTLRTKLEGV